MVLAKTLLKKKNADIFVKSIEVRWKESYDAELTHNEIHWRISLKKGKRLASMGLAKM